MRMTSELGVGAAGSESYIKDLAKIRKDVMRRRQC